MSHEETLKSQNNLYNLITNKHINMFISFPEKSEFSEGFINWLSPQYFKTFTDIYDEHIGKETETKIIKLINSPWYCNKETETKIIKFLIPSVKKALEDSKKYRMTLTTKRLELNDITKHITFLSENILTPINKAILRHKNNRIEFIKDDIIGNCFDICEHLKGHKTDSVEFNFYITILENLKSVNLAPNQQHRYDSFVKKSESSIKTSYVITTIIAIIALVRLLYVLV